MIFNKAALRPIPNERLVTSLKLWIDALGNFNKRVDKGWKGNSVRSSVLDCLHGMVGLSPSYFGLVWFMIEAALNERKLWWIIVDMGTSEKEGGSNLEYFQGLIYFGH